MTYLTQVTEVYRVDNEEDVIRMIDEAKQSRDFTLTKHSSQYKERKAKGEVIDQWFKLSLTKQFNDEKEPDTPVEISYEVG